MEQDRIDTALDKQKISNISVAQGATSPLKPASPRAGLNLALGFVFASFGAIGLGFLAENMDHSFKRPKDVEEKLRLPLLTTVPFLSENGFSKSHAKGGTPALLPDVRMSCGMLGEAGESYETLCHRLLSGNGGTAKGPQVIGVIGSRYGEGVSTVAANLATCLASRSNERVLLVEADLQSPSVHKTFGIQDSPGLTDIVAEKIDFAVCIKPSNRPNLDVIPSGQGNLTLSQLADSKEFSEMLDILRSEYSFVIFDLPPIFKSNSALSLAGQTDGVVLVVGAEGISWQVGQKAIKRLAETNAKVLGVALNKRFYHIPEWLHRKL
jgi:capsular exopolysaccharide synthesis family protein